MMSLRDQAYSKYLKTNSETKKAYYKDLKRLVHDALFNEKRIYYDHNINSEIKYPRMLWKNLKNYLLPPKTTELPLIFNDPNIINNHFLN